MKQKLQEVSILEDKLKQPSHLPLVTLVTASAVPELEKADRPNGNPTSQPLAVGQREARETEANSEDHPSPSSPLLSPDVFADTEPIEQSTDPVPDDDEVQPTLIVWMFEAANSESVRNYTNLLQKRSIEIMWIFEAANYESVHNYTHLLWKRSIEIAAHFICHRRCHWMVLIPQNA